MTVINLNSISGISSITAQTSDLQFYESGGDPLTFGNLQASSINGGPLSGARNRIINGDMRIDQRNGGASVTGNDQAMPVDRFKFEATQTGKLTGQQNAGSVTPPAGFTNYVRVTSSSAYSVLSADVFCIEQRIEGYNVADFGFGTVGAVTVTLSFWVRSSLTGTFGGSLQNSASNRSYPFSFTINSVDTWEYNTVTVLGDTSGTWLTDNGKGLVVIFGLGAGSNYTDSAGSWKASAVFQPTGSVNLVGTSGATFYLTGVQLEPGTVATPFERRSYGQELALCQRYAQYFFWTAGESYSTIAGTPPAATLLMCEMRATPTVTEFFIAGGQVTAIGYGPTTSTCFSPIYSVGGNSWYRQANYLLTAEL